MQPFYVKLSVLRHDGLVESESVLTVLAINAQEAMASVIQEQDGWFTVEIVEDPTARAHRSP